MTAREKQWFEDAAAMSRLVEAARDGATAGLSAADSAQKTVENLVVAGVIEPKAWWQSLGINGSVVSAISGLAALAAVAAQLFGYRVDVGVLTELLMGLTALVVSAMTWWGRVKAAQPISKTQVLPGLTLKGQP